MLANFGPTAILVFPIGAGEQVAQAQIPRMGLAQQQQTKRLVAFGIVADIHIATHDGFDAGPACFLVKLHEPEYVGQVSERQRRHVVRLRRAYRFADAHDSVGDGILAMQTQMDEGGLHDARDKNLGGILPLRALHPRKKLPFRIYMLTPPRMACLLVSRDMQRNRQACFRYMQDSDAMTRERLADRVWPSARS